MPELRQNLATKEWVIIATDRAEQPEKFKSLRKAGAPVPELVDKCPFCPGNEKLSSPETFVLGDKSKWKVRAVQNKFPALVPAAPQPASQQTVYRCLPGEGAHEVIVDSPSHRGHPAELSRRQMVDLLSVYKDRFNAFLENEKVSLTLLFKNHGAGSDHPHSQLIGSSVVPSNIRHRMDEAQKYFDQHSACVFCKMIDEERRQGVRVLADTENFCAFVLYAALSPFHIWILPKRHTASFGEATPKEIENLAEVMQTILKKFYVGLNNPDYNYVIQSTPLDRGTKDAFHWYVSLVVRLSRVAGFELGSGMYLNNVIPEEAARFLNGIKA